MLTRLLKKDEGAQTASEWIVGDQSPPAPFRPAYPPLPEHANAKPPAEPKPGAGQERIVELETRIRNLEREVEQRAQAAFQKGLQQGDANVRQQIGAQTEAAFAKLARSVEEISGLRQRCRHEAESDVVKLALAIARRVLHRELTVDPEAMLGLVKAALQKLDSRELHRLRVHPDHAATIKRHFESMGLPRRLEVEADPTLERGAALFETTRGSLDASAETQFAEIERGFTDLVRHAK